MYDVMLKAKLHMVKVTHAEIDYDGSCAIDEGWLKMTGMREYEQIQIYNKDNGERFTTYVLKATEGSRIISLNGAAARKAVVGDRVIICAYRILMPNESLTHKPIMLYFDNHNEVERVSHNINKQTIEVDQR